MTTNSISPWPLVRQNGNGHPVKTLQYLLRDRGHEVTVDGVFGPVTGAAVRAFQQKETLAVDGVAGPVTWQALVSGMLSG
ncbi:MAG TPA: peptidoglycan-binding domain-containing protein [Trebonia sp.]